MRTSILLVLILLAACGEPPPAPEPGRRPMIVVGIDGGEWRVIRDLWEQGRLPNFRRIAERGVTAELRTKYTASPIIWTTIATGVTPAEHGITGFVVPTAEGDVPVSSTVRKAPALWNMVSRARRSVGVLGWWASWPAEPVSGVVVSDRATMELPDRVHPPEWLPRLSAALERARREGDAGANPFGANKAAAERDRVVDLLARDLATEELDLLLVYFRGVDIASHHHFKHYRPQAFDPPPPAAEVAAHAEAIPREYEAVDQALGALLAAAPEANLVVISDHGFKPARPEIVRVVLDLDDLLARLGYQVRADGQPDLAQSRLYAYGAEDFRRARGVRFGGAVAPAERPRVRAALAADLARITYGNGEPAFRLRDARPADGEVDFVVLVRQRPATEELLVDGDPGPLAGLVREVSRISGTHGETTHGIFLAAGPDVASGAALDGIHVHDVAPTLLYGLGLPVAGDFTGRAWVELYTEELRRRRPLRRIASWAPAGEAGGTTTRSAADEALLEELGALGYLE